jgi:hypothetical protein
VPVSTSLSVCRYDVVKKRSPAGKEKKFNDHTPEMP